MASDKAIETGVGLVVAVLLGAILINTGMLVFDVGDFVQTRIAMVTKKPSLRGINNVILTDKSMYNFIDTAGRLDDFRYSENEPIVEENIERLLNSANGRWRLNTRFLEDESVYYIEVVEVTP